MLSATDMAQIRAAVTGIFPDSCQVKRRAIAADGMGGQTSTLNNQGSPTACLVKILRNQPSEGIIAERAAGRDVLEVIVPANVDVLEKDQLAVTLAFSTPANRTFEVIAVRYGSFEIERKCYCVELKG
jgi:hypothetical protein